MFILASWGTGHQSGHQPLAAFFCVPFQTRFRQAGPGGGIRVKNLASLPTAGLIKTKVRCRVRVNRSLLVFWNDDDMTINEEINL